MQKCIFKAALLGLSIAIFWSTSTFSTPADHNTIAGITRSNAQVGSTRNALTQETRRSPNSSRNVVNRPYMARVSWYRHGTITANGERFNPSNLTVAHRTLPFNTRVRFTNPETGTEVVARVNDRGPFIRGREYDLSMGTARSLGIIDKGVANVIVEILQEIN